MRATHGQKLNGQVLQSVLGVMVLLLLLLLAFGDCLESGIVDGGGGVALGGRAGVVAVPGDADVPLALQMNLKVARLDGAALAVLGDAAGIFSHDVNKVVHVLLQELSCVVRVRRQWGEVGVSR